MMVAADLMRRGYKIAFPYGEDWDYDLIVCRGEKLERVQVKYSHSDGDVIHVEINDLEETIAKGPSKEMVHYVNGISGGATMQAAFLNEIRGTALEGAMLLGR